LRLGDAVIVAAMRRDDPVAALKRSTDADGDRLLADVAMHDAVDLADEVVGRCAFLEVADRQRPAERLALRVMRQVWRGLCTGVILRPSAGLPERLLANRPRRSRAPCSACFIRSRSGVADSIR
jgi:hypothetical protein